MAVNINSAYRVREILKTISTKPDKAPSHQVWAEVFKIEETDASKKNFRISRCLADLHDEVELIRSEMVKLGYSPELYNSSLNSCNNVFAVQLVTSQWSSPKQHIKPEVLVVLGFCSEILPNEEELVDLTNLEELSVMATELKSMLANSTLPPYTILIIEKHLSKIEEAISKYRAVGAKALEDVVQSAYGEVIANEGVFKDAKGSPEVNKLSVMWQKTKSVLDGVVSADKRLGAAQGMAQKGNELIEFIQNINV
ncbi:hypothetical protein HJ107_24295 [Vibrio parahaemolyticus]|uniref:hypothetical protein n=1 Tax=Vibrio parahaemolyticus TaxID=670 RepID=UPI001869883A|nr:hypothetical protein [Vibrio parahaemolyticus]EKB1967593.1 hypothetical protein [Vibrio parahaemolyticus]ELA8094068.1 hypothetical protein [Vibrio parahaemolyticus]ELC3210329.1 hypothetical protein [Vibrio parahaemolyticus]MBE4089884.1 hypothetical protein [Vibrio parahaemolyticus]MBE4111893.1 hypothetical protein [Vibrio parahaemolyticus]